MAGITLGCAARAQSLLCRLALMPSWNMCCRPGWYLSREDLLSVRVAGCSSRRGIGPNGQGDNTIIAFTPATSTPLQPVRLVSDPELSPLDLAIAPNGNIVVSSEHPFGAEDAVTTVREYDASDGHLVRVFSPDGKAAFRKPRGLRFSSSGLLYCVARDEVVSFDFMTGKCRGPVAQLPRLNGQALVLFPD